MPVNIWSHLCDYATVDHGSRKATIVGEFDRINARSVPATHPFMAVATKWAVQDGEQFTQRVRIVSPDGTTVAEAQNQPIQATVPAGRREGTYTHINYFMGTTFQEYGTYLIEVLIDGEVDHALRLEIIESTAGG